MSLFLLATLAYRFANGLLFLAIAWDLVQYASGGATPLAVSVIVGFLPAVVAAPFARRLLERVDTRQLTLCGTAGLLCCAITMIPVLHATIGILIINFIILFIFFILEGSWDALLASTVNCLPAERGDKLNSRQSAATQAGLLIGGLPLGPLIRNFGSEAPFVVAAGLYLITLLLLSYPGFGQTLNNHQATGPHSENAQLAGAEYRRAIPPGWATLAVLCLVWPCLTLVNMLMPLVAHSLAHGKVDHAAVMDASIGFGMAFIGVAYEKLMGLPAALKQSVIAIATMTIPLPFVVLLTIPYSLPVVSAAFFLCGTGFGALRVGVRKRLIKTQPAHRVGQIVALCNAYAFPILAVLALLYSQTWTAGPIVPLITFSLMAIIGVAASAGKKMDISAATRDA